MFLRLFTKIGPSSNNLIGWNRHLEVRGSFHLFEATSLTCCGSSGPGTPPSRRRTVLRPHTQEGGLGLVPGAGLYGRPGSLPPQERQAGAEPLLPHSRNSPPPGLGGHVPAEISLVWNSEWHLHSILVHMKSTEALYSSFRLSGMEMRI